MDLDATLTIEGYLDTEPVTDHRGRARFRVISSPTDDITEETVLPCTTGDPRITHLLLTELCTGDLLRVAGTLVLPTHGSSSLQLHVDALEVLRGVPLHPAPDDADLTCTQHGTYTAVQDSSSPALHLWTSTGTWVGTATSPDDINTTITNYETTTA